MMEFPGSRRAAIRRLSVQPFPRNTLFSQLSISDQAAFVNLMKHFASAVDRNKRNLGLSVFVKHLGMIHSFVCRGDAFDAVRGAICGIEFTPNSFLINTQRLKRLMARSKSSMNGCFQRLGYTVCRPARDLGEVLGEICPGYGPQRFFARQWCVRRAEESSAVSFAPNLAIEIAGPTREGKGAGEGLVHPFDIGNLLNHPDEGGRAVVTEE
jgi:hypothetical protein